MFIKDRRGKTPRKWTEKQNLPLDGTIIVSNGTRKSVDDRNEVKSTPCG